MSLYTTRTIFHHISRTMCTYCHNWRQYTFNRHSLLPLIINSQRSPLLVSSSKRFVLNNGESLNLLSSFTKRAKPQTRRNWSDDKTHSDDWTQISQLSLFQRYKVMFKKYWYVAIPVHAVTSALWFAALYIIAKSGLDVKLLMQRLKPIIEKIPLPEFIKKPLTNPEDESGNTVGYFAIALILYKLATPARYASTVAASGYAIKTLVQKGLIKPVPSRDKIKQVIRESNLKQVIDERMRRREAMVKAKKLKKKPPIR